MSNKATEFRRLLDKPGILLLPGMHDCLMAKIVEAAGFSAACMGDGAVSVSVLGQPDFGLYTMTEVVNRAREVCSAVSIPVMIDVGTGYGNALNVLRTVREIEAAGAGGVFFEDQTWPKKCGHLAGRTLISLAEMTAKIRAAVDARQNPDLVIAARTDARAVEGMPAAIERLCAYGEAGADVVFIDALESMDDLRLAPQEIPYPLMANMLEGGKTPYLSASELEELGYKIVVWPETLMYAGFRAMLDVARELKATGTVSEETRDNMTDFLTLNNEFLGLPELYALEQKYGVEV